MVRLATPASRAPQDTPLDRELFSTTLVSVGTFRAAVEDPRFRDSGPIQRPVFVFPRTTVVIRHEGRAPFTADPSIVTFYNAGQRYTRYAADPRGDRCEWYAVRRDVLIDIVAQVDESAVERPDRPFEWTHGPSDLKSYALQRLVFHHVQAGTVPDPLAVEELVLRLLDRLTREAASPPRPGCRRADDDSGHAAVVAARTLLQQQFRQSLSLDEVARESGVSPFHLCRLFRREVGTSIHRYRHELRLRESLEMVGESPCDLTRIALQLGFSSHSHFTAAFRAAFAVTPSEFRRHACRRQIAGLTRRLH